MWNSQTLVNLSCEGPTINVYQSALQSIQGLQVFENWYGQATLPGIRLYIPSSVVIFTWKPEPSSPAGMALPQSAVRVYPGFSYVK